MRILRTLHRQQSYWSAISTWVAETKSRTHRFPYWLFLTSTSTRTASAIAYPSRCVAMWVVYDRYGDEPHGPPRLSDVSDSCHSISFRL